MPPIREKKHRLPEVMYHGRKCVAFTANESRRQPLLAREDIHEALRERLTSAGAAHGSLVPPYCLMPDHLHVMFLGLDDASRPKLAMDRFKYDFGNWIEERHPELDMQKDYYDRIVRRSVRMGAARPVRRLEPGSKRIGEGHLRVALHRIDRLRRRKSLARCLVAVIVTPRAGTEPAATRFAFPCSKGVS